MKHPNKCVATSQTVFKLGAKKPSNTFKKKHYDERKTRHFKGLYNVKFYKK